MTTQERALKIKMILMDVDGTLTDGTLWLLPDGQEIKGYHVHDGHGILLAHLAGLRTGIISGKTSQALEKRAERLRIDELHQGILDKKKVFLEILQKYGLKPEETAYIGDDLSDVEVMESVGLSAAVAGAHPDVLRTAHYLCTMPGGKGAVREFIEFILKAQGHWPGVQEKIKHLGDKKPAL